MASAKKPTKWKLDDLHPHPRQAELFSDLSDTDLEALADDILRNGLQHPIEITSSGTIIAGHQRVRAARKLGWKTIAVVIRKDLEDQGPDAIEQHLIDDNRLRRQLDLLSQVRCIVALHALYKPDPDPAKWQPRPNLRDVICQQLGMGNKNASRYLKVLETPMPVQHTLSRGELPLVLADRVAGLPSEHQQEIAGRIESGEEPRKVVDSFLRNVRRRQPSATDTYIKFVKLLDRLLVTKPQAVEEISKWVANESAIELFEQAVVTCQQLIRWTKTSLELQDYTQ